MPDEVQITGEVNAVSEALPQDQVSGSMLELARELQARGLIDKLPQVKRIKMLKLLEPEMAKEKEEALQPVAALVKKEKADSNFIDEIMKPIRAAVNEPVAFGKSAIKGAMRSLNPAEYLGADVDQINAAMNLPFIRGAELAARMFVPEDQRPDLTTYAKVVEDQKRIDGELRRLAPGVQEGVEMAMFAGGVANLGKLTFKEGPKLLKEATTRIAAYRASRATDKTKNMALQRLKISEGPLLEAIVNRPEEVLSLSKTNNVNMKDIAFQLHDELEKVEKNLGARVGKYRRSVETDTKTRVPVPDNIPKMINAIRSRATIQGESFLPNNIEKALRSSEKAAGFGVTTPAETMKLIDALDGVIKYGNEGKEYSHIIQNANYLTTRLRRSLKDMVRQHNPIALEEAANIESATRTGPRGIREIGQQRKEIAFQLWSDADDAYRSTIDVRSDILSKLESRNFEQAESYVANLFNKNKTIQRDNLIRALNDMEKVDPTAIGHGEAFYGRLANIKAADKIKDVKLEVNRVLQENTNEIVRYWTNQGEQFGGLMLGGPTTFAALHLDKGGPVTTAAAATAWMAGRLGGRNVGFKIGQMMAKPERVLEQAIKSKQLSTQARKLAQDMLYLNQNYGPKSSIAFLDLVGPIPVVNELVQFSQSNKGEENAGR